MKRRGAGGDAPPSHLMSLVTWISENRSPDPHTARIEWSRARRQWVREHAGSMEMVNRLFDPSLGYDPGPWQDDPRRAAEIERSLIEVLAVPTARRDRP